MLLFLFSWPVVTFPISTNLSQSLIAYYKFDGNLLDSSGNEHHGQLNSIGNEYYSVDNYINTKSFYFDGDTRIEVASLSNYKWNSTRYFSISLWLKRTLNNDENMAVINNGYYYCSSFEIRLGKDNGGRGLQCAIFASDHEDMNYNQPGPKGSKRPGGKPAFGHSFKINDAVTINRWIHVVLTYNEYKTDGEQLSLYIDGKLYDTAGITDHGEGINIKDHALYIGHVGEDCVLNREWFIGYMDEIMLFDVELHTNDVANIYNDGVSTKQNDDDEVRTTQYYNYGYDYDNDYTSTTMNTLYDNNANNQNHQTNEYMEKIVMFIIICLVVIGAVFVIYFYRLYKRKKDGNEEIAMENINHEERVEMIEGAQTNLTTTGRTNEGIMTK